MGNFIDNFDQKYGCKLGKRKDTFKQIFEILEAKQKDFYVIVETGCIRIQNNWEGDGYCTILFDDFVNEKCTIRIILIYEQAQTRRSNYKLVE